MIKKTLRSDLNQKKHNVQQIQFMGNVNALPYISNMIKILQVILFLVCAQFFLSACSEPKEKPKQLKLATNIWPGYEPLYLARRLNFFEESSIRLVELTSASQVIRAFKNGAVDAAALTIDEVLLLLQAGLDLRLLLVMDVSNGADVIMADKRFKSLSDLKGKRIGVENTALGAYFLTRALQVSGLNNSDFKIVSLKVNEQEKAYEKGLVDAVVTFEPVRSKLLDKGVGIIFDSSKIPNEIVDVLVIRAEFLKDGNEEVKNLISAWFRALNYFKKYKDLSASYMQERLKIPPEEVIKSFDGLILPGVNENIKMLSGGKDSIKNSTKQLAEFMFENGLLKQRVNSDILFDPILISKIIQ